jgi:hypothetical protein
MMAKHRVIFATMGAVLVFWVSVFQGYRKPFDLTLFAAIGFVAGALLSYMPRFVTWTIVGAVIPTAFVPVHVQGNWNELANLHSLSLCIIGGIVGFGFGLTVRKEARWYQLSLRTFALLITLAAVCFSPIGRAIMRGQVQQRAVREIQSKGGTASYSPDRSLFWGLLLGRDVVQRVTAIQWNGDVPIRIGNSLTYLNGQAVTDADVESLLSFPAIESLTLAGAQITDLHIVAKLSKLKQLDLRGVSADVSPLKDLRELRRLDLRGANVHPDSVERLRADLPNCKILFE